MRIVRLFVMKYSEDKTTLEILYGKKEKEEVMIPDFLRLITITY